MEARRPVAGPSGSSSAYGSFHRLLRLPPDIRSAEATANLEALVGRLRAHDPLECSFSRQGSMTAAQNASHLRAAAAAAHAVALRIGRTQPASPAASSSHLSVQSTDHPDEPQVRAQLERILASEAFDAS